MNAIEQIIPVKTTEGGKRAVSGRALHEFLEIGTAYNVWISRMIGYGFEEHRDYAIISDRVLSSSRAREYEQADHALTLDMAKELCMIQRSPLGKQAREYFIEVEKRARAQQQIDVSTPQGVLALAQQLTATAEQLVVAHEQLEGQRPLVQQAITYQGGDNMTARQDFAREIISWAQTAGFEVTQPQVFLFLAKKLGLFIRGDRADAGNATSDAIRRGLADTEKGTAKNGHNYSTGKLSPKGKAYAFERIVRYMEQHGTLELPDEEKKK